MIDKGEPNADSTLGLSPFSFNLGVEFGQLAVTAVFGSSMFFRADGMTRVVVLGAVMAVGVASLTAVRGGPHPLDRYSSQLRWNPGS